MKVGTLLMLLCLLNVQHWSDSWLISCFATIPADSDAFFRQPAPDTTTPSLQITDPACFDYPNDDPNQLSLEYSATPHTLTSSVVRTCKMGYQIIGRDDANCIEVIPGNSALLNWDLTLPLCEPVGK
uniref:Sushi domain-containing protein n=1 Tax=Plectus sambesii TaxID=2011161 RepID=A0A914VTY0_9BILA